MADITIGNMAPLDALSGKEMIPCEIDGKNYKITPDQIAPFVDIANIPTFDSITGQEKVIVVRDGKAQGLVTLTQIRQVVLPGYTYEDLSMDAFPEMRGICSLSMSFYDRLNAAHIEIPVSKKNSVFVITLEEKKLSDSGFFFTTSTLYGINNGDRIQFCNENGIYRIDEGETVALMAPDDAKFLCVNIRLDTEEDKYSIQVGELIITTRLNALENRVNLIEQSPSPANLDGVSREEFTALKKELDSLKSQMTTAVVGKETI